MKSNKLLLVVILLSLGVFLVSGYLLTNLLRTGSVLSLPNTGKRGAIIFDGPESAAVNQAFTLRISVNTNNQNVNAVGVFLRFDPEKLQVNELNTLKSFCQFYPEKKFDNRLGIVSLSCGSPHPGVKGQSDLIELRMTPLAIGTTSVRLTNDSKILLSDGKGTNILHDYPSWEVQIGAGL